jgi:outer membrane immunogenic protein
MLAVLRAGLAAVALLTIPVATMAADVDLKPAPPAPATAYVAPWFNWTGFYMGANFGAVPSSTTFTDGLTGASLTSSNAGWLFGGQIGFNWQTGYVVWGIEGTVDGTSLNAATGPFAVAVDPLQVSVNSRWQSTLTPRLGVAFDRWLGYAKVGVGWVGNTANITDQATGAVTATSIVTNGWVLGGGVEYAFAPSWTAKIEYDYFRANTWGAGTSVAGDPVVNVARKLSTITGGFNYKFNWY